jgi:hypothetical protein
VNSRISFYNRLKPTLALLLATLFATASAFGWQQSAASTSSSSTSTADRELANSLKVETIKEVVTALSADDMQGRGTGQPGGDKAANYIADRFAKLGLKPLGEKNTYLQPIRFKEFQFMPETSFKVGDETLKLGADFVPTQPYTGDESATGQLVFVAYALNTTTPKRNDLTGIDLKGKIVVMLEGPPRNVSKEAWKKANIQTDIMVQMVGLGAAGIIILNEPDPEHPYSEMADYITRRQIGLADDPELPPFLPPFLSVSDAAADKLFAGVGLTKQKAIDEANVEGFKPYSLKQSASITVRFKKGKGVGNNVAGLLEGSDPKLKAEALVYSAHYDAFGLSADNKIYHGAADNGLGVAEMLAIAETLSKAPTKPRRSIIFLAVTGEEYGGYGSTYWVKNPTWKIKQVAADLNLDGMGTEVYGPVKVVVGYGAEHSTLGNLLNDAASATGLRVIPDPMPEEKSFYRSDHYFFVKRGIPGIMILGAPDGETKAWIDRLKQWEKTDYHQPTDVIRDDWNWDGPRTIAVVGLLMGLRVANDENMPSWVPTSIFNRERGTDKPAPPEP